MPVADAMTTHTRFPAYREGSADGARPSLVCRRIEPRSMRQPSCPTPMVLRYPIAFALLLSAGCAEQRGSRQDAQRHGVQPPPDTCGARAHAHLLGQSVERAPEPSPTIRIASDVDPVTEDHRPGRLNILYSGSTRRIVGVRCY